MSRLRTRPALAFVSAFFLASIPSASALVIFGGGGSGNTTDPGTGLPWDNAGSVNGASGVFLGHYTTGSWVLTAAHVANSGAPGITLGGVFYPGVAGSGVRVLNGDSSTTDLYLFRVTGAPETLPNLTFASAHPTAGTVVDMIGFGQTENLFKRWDVSIVAGAENDVWTETANEAVTDYVGYTLKAGIGQRWGQARYVTENQIVNVGTGPTSTFLTRFDRLNGSTVGVVGDSGGPVFYSVGASWALAGIFSGLATLGTPDTKPPPVNQAVATGATVGPADSTAGAYHLNVIADMVVYGDFIEDVIGAPIPEPAAAGGVLGLAVAACVGGLRRRRPRG